MRNLIRTRRFLPAALAVSTLLLAALIAVPLLVAHRGHTAASPLSPSPAPSTSPVPTPSDAVTLIQGAHLVDGVQVGFPHTPIGAVSAAADYLAALASTLDPDYAASVMRVAGDPGDNSLPASLATSTVSLRADLHLPTSGPLSPPVAFQTTVQMYQLRETTANSVLVLLLALGTFTNAHGGIAQTTGVFPLHMRWVGDDWKLAAIGGGQDYSGLNATPDTAAAVSNGWSALIAAPEGSTS
jgi:hypothetical protein